MKVERNLSTVLEIVSPGAMLYQETTACSGIVCKYAYLCMAEKARTSAGFPKCIKALISLKLIPEKENLLAVLIFDICNTEQLLHEGRCSAIVCNHNIIPFQGTVLQSIIPILV